MAYPNPSMFHSTNPPTHIPQKKAHIFSIKSFTFLSYHKISPFINHITLKILFQENKNMCSYKFKKQGGVVDISSQSISHINGRPVLQPYNNSHKKNNSCNVKISPSPKIKKVNVLDTNTSNEKSMTPKITKSSPPISPKIKPTIKKVKVDSKNTILGKDSSFMMVEVAGSIAAATREQVANRQVQRKQRIAHYGRTNSPKLLSVAVDSTSREAKRCSFITPNSDPIYIAYHDEEWGVPVHDDNLLFELLVLTVAQVGSDWTSVLKRRQDFRDAFSGFDAEVVAKYNEKKIYSTSIEYGIELSQVRGVVDNSKRILEMKKQFGSFHKYVWGFVSNKPIRTQYKACNKIPVKTSKSETMSKDMVKKGFRYVGPTIIHSFMQAVGLTNDHIITCPRHAQCATQKQIAM